jgi:glucose-1-phosphate cytidylyltransferase
MEHNEMKVHHGKAEPWRVTLVDTGEDTMTGGRLKRVREYVKDEREIFFTYGDGVSDVNISELLEFYRSQGVKVTLTATVPAGRFGVLDIDENHKVHTFKEKPKSDGAMINGGFFVLSPEVIDYIESDYTSWEREPLERLAREGNLAAYAHHGFWQPMDTLRDKMMLEDLWRNGRAPWKIW